MTSYWRTGTKVGRTLYFGGNLVGLMDTPELAQGVVAALGAESRMANRIQELRAQALDLAETVHSYAGHSYPDDIRRCRADVCWRALEVIGDE